MKTKSKQSEQSVPKGYELLPNDAVIQQGDYYRSRSGEWLECQNWMFGAKTTDLKYARKAKS